MIQSTVFFIYANKAILKKKMESMRFNFREKNLVLYFRIPQCIYVYDNYWVYNYIYSRDLTRVDVT